MSVKVNSELVWSGGSAIAGFDVAQLRALTKSAILVQNAAVKEVVKQVYSTKESDSYKRTGALKNSITRNVSKTDAYVGTPLEYAPYVEFGTRFVKARPFLHQALLVNKQKIIEIFKGINKAVKYVD